MTNWWNGDEKHKLPAQRVEPYRLWFEFLRLATMDKHVVIDEATYASWGDYKTFPFSKWWGQHWRQLFAVGVGVTEMSASDARQVPANSLVVSIPLHQDPKRSLDQIKQMLADRGAGSTLKDMPSGQFGFTMGKTADGVSVHPSTRFLKNLDKVRLLMHIYRFWVQFPDLDDRKRLDATARAYVSWASGWNKKVKSNKWDRPLIEIPHAMSSYVKHLDEKGDRQRVSRDSGLVADPDDRRQIARYIAKARRLATNVGRGEFPSVYD